MNRLQLEQQIRETETLMREADRTVDESRKVLAISDPAIADVGDRAGLLADTNALIAEYLEVRLLPDLRQRLIEILIVDAGTEGARSMGR